MAKASKKIVEPEPAPPPPERKVSAERAQEMKEYAAAKRRYGHTQVKIWVPKQMVKWLHRMADDARTLHEVGLNPMDRLPATLIERRQED